MFCRRSDPFAEVYLDEGVYNSPSRGIDLPLTAALKRAPDAASLDAEILAAEQQFLKRPNVSLFERILQLHAAQGVIPQEEVERLCHSGLLHEEEWFDSFGVLYANTDRPFLALRWSLAEIQFAETGGGADVGFGVGDAYAAVGYCLLRLELCSLALEWAEACSAGQLREEAVLMAALKDSLSDVDACVVKLEAFANRLRIVLSAPEDDLPRLLGENGERIERLRADLGKAVPGTEFYMEVHKGLTSLQVARMRCGAVHPYLPLFNGSALLNHRLVAVHSLLELAAIAERGSDRTRAEQCIEAALEILPEYEPALELTPW